jgi:2-hydroxychromene-2-carboxylate isomerase
LRRPHRFPAERLPVNSVKALRGALVALEHGKISAYGRRVFEAYFGEDRDISQDAVPRTVVGEVGLDPAEFFDRIGQAPYKDRVRANTDECIRRGGFGSPTLFVGESMFFGNDRLVLVENELRTRSRG